MKRIVTVTLLIFFLCGSAAAYILYSKVQSVEHAKLTNLPTSGFKIKSGDTLHDVFRRLSNYHNLDNFSFKLWLKLNNDRHNVKTGYYELVDGMPLTQAISIFNAGQVKQFSVTFIEGSTFEQWLAQLKNIDELNYDLPDSHKQIYETLISKDTFCENALALLEGCLLPDTYFFTYQSKASEILSRAYFALKKTLEEAWTMRFLDIPLKTPYEALILASIIEKETAIDAERSEIAGVFTNRLEKNMRLQTDPTVIYGVGDSYAGDITRQHLRTPTPYNTYVIKGLTPTPIAMPSKASVLAAVQPALTDSLYFVATGDGGHQFSSNLADHNRAVRAYLNKMKNKNDGS